MISLGTRCLGFVVPLMLVPGPRLLLADCSGRGIFGALVCQGSCEDREECTHQEERFNGDTYSYCGCPGGKVPACCHIAKEKETGAFAALGDCPSCPASGACQLKDVRKEIQAVCQ